jgi:3-hydroxyacyl-[acyl-carrier-protein] dehydratase
LPSTSREAFLFNPEPTAYLPHRYPFLFLDRILTREPSVGASALKRVSATERHFPDILMVEGLAQLAGVATVQAEGEGGFLATIDHAEFHGAAVAGDTLIFTVRVAKAFGRLFLVEGEVTVAEKLLARATLTLGVGKL